MRRTKITRTTARLLNGKDRHLRALRENREPVLELDQQASPAEPKSLAWREDTYYSMWRRYFTPKQERRMRHKSGTAEARARRDA